MKNSIVLVLVGILVGCGQKDSAKEFKEFKECVARGVAYFKEVGSYPIMQSPLYRGKDADTEIKERCSRTPTAF